MRMQPGELERLLARLETCPIQKKGLFWRLFKLDWKKLLFIALMSVLPGGIFVNVLMVAFVVPIWCQLSKLGCRL